jgi:hypothetical protein
MEEMYDNIGMDPFDSPVPGESLTNNPDQRYPWERPPKYTDINEALQDTFLELTSEEIYSDLLDQIRSGMPLDELTQYIIFKGYSAGYWTTDLMLLLAEPVLYILIALAEHNGIFDYTVYDGEQDELEDNEAVELIEDDAARMKPKKSKMSQAMGNVKDVVPDSLLSMIEQAPVMGEE